MMDQTDMVDIRDMSRLRLLVNCNSYEDPTCKLEMSVLEVGSDCFNHIIIISKGIYEYKY